MSYVSTPGALTLMGWRLMTFQPKFSNGITREVVSVACCDEVYV